MADAPSSYRSGFSSSLSKHIQSRLPYTGQMVIQNVEELNPKFKDFYKEGSYRQEVLAKHSISDSLHDDFYNPVGVGIDKNYLQYLYANVDSDKGKRLREYRVMAAYSKVADALDEICDEVINKDDKGEIVKLVLKGRDFELNISKELNKEFQRIVGYFDLENKGWEYFRHLLMEGELYFEHIIHQEHKDAGILGLLNIPCEIIDPIYDNVQNFIIKGFILKKPEIVQNTGVKRSPINTKIELIPMDRNQVTYIHSGIWNDDKTMRLPYIENARKAYRQLSLIEDAIIIYRLVRAPERLVFDVDVGNLSAPKAEAYLKKLMHQYWQKKTFDTGGGGTINSFNPQSMLDNFWFAKRTGSEGTKVTSLAGGQNLDQLADLYYFAKDLYKSLKVPTNRVDPDSHYSDGADILREELKFAKFVMRLQQGFAGSIKNAFFTHLKLKGLWETYKLKEDNISVIFNPPSNFYELREQQKFELRANNFNALVSNSMIAQSYSQKRYLGWSDEDILANREWLKKDAALKFELAQTEAAGPNWREAYTPGQGAEGVEPGGGGAPAGGGPSLGGVNPPEFGPEPKEGEEVPEGGGGGQLPEAPAKELSNLEIAQGKTAPKGGAK